MIKETQGKLPIQEIDWEFIKEMLATMSRNKDKYPSENWKEKMDNPKELINAAQRHLLEILTDKETDKEDGSLHCVKVALNCMMYYHQINNLDKMPF